MASVEAFDKMKQMSPEERVKDGARWKEWMEEHKASIVEPGAPVAKAKRASAAGVEDIRNEVGGYMVVQAESLEAAAALFANNPMIAAAPETRVEVMEIMPMM